jgi:hypothetical protein
MINEHEYPQTSITGAGRSACPEEGAGNQSERFLAAATRSGQELPPRAVAKSCHHAQWPETAATRSGIPQERNGFLPPPRAENQ